MRIAVTQRVDLSDTGERRDALDQRWHALARREGLVLVPVPNHPAQAMAAVRALDPAGLILSGGNDLASVAGEATCGVAPERDEVERLLLRCAARLGVPVLGVCRGAQMMLDFCGVPPEPVCGHAGTVHALSPAPAWSGAVPAGAVGSYHRFGVREVPPGWEVVARAADGVVEAARRRDLPWVAVMWHPEREGGFCALERGLWGGGGAP